MMDPCTVDYDEREFVQHMSSDQVSFTKKGLYVNADVMERNVHLPDECLVLKRWGAGEESVLSSTSHYSRVDDTEVWCLLSRGLKWSKHLKKDLSGESTHPTHDEFRVILTDSLSHESLRGVPGRVGCFSPVRSLFAYLPVPIDDPLCIVDAVGRFIGVHRSTLLGIRYRRRTSPFTPENLVDEITKSGRKIKNIMREAQFCAWVRTLMMQGVSWDTPGSRIETHSHSVANVVDDIGAYQRLKLCQSDMCNTNAREISFLDITVLNRFLLYNMDCETRVKL